jgi:hypothetical protein
MSCRGRKNGVLGKAERFEFCLAFPHFFSCYYFISIKGNFFEMKYCFFHILTILCISSFFDTASLPSSSREVSTGISFIHALRPSSKYGYQVPTSPLPILLTAVDVAVFGTTSIQFREEH